MTGPVTVQTPGAVALARLARLGFPKVAEMLSEWASTFGPLRATADAATLAHCALNRMEARDREQLPGSVPLIRARYAVARRLVRLALADTSPAPVNPPRIEEVN